MGILFNYGLALWNAAIIQSLGGQDETDR
jgi:hypothetical protein